MAYLAILHFKIKGSKKGYLQKCQGCQTQFFVGHFPAEFSSKINTPAPANQEMCST